MSRLLKTCSWLGLACAAGLAAGTIGLGAHDRDPATVRAAIVELRQAFAAADWAAMCDQLTQSARREAGSLAHGRIEDCPGDLQEAFATIDRGNGIVGGDRITIGQVHVDGDRATATIATGSWRHAIALTHQKGRWKAESFFGTAPAHARQAALASRTATFPPAHGHPVQATTRDGRPCPPPSTADYPAIAGGCELAATGDRIDVTVLTPYGHAHFGTCEIDYHARIDHQGRAWIDDFHVYSQALDGCSDLDECPHPDGQVIPPWKGRLAANPDGTITHTIRACLSTCIGHYTGNLDIHLTPTAGGWAARLANAAIGTSGLRLDGRLRTDTTPTLRPAGT